MALITGSANELFLLSATAPPTGRALGRDAVRSAFNKRDYALRTGGNEESADTVIAGSPTSPAASTVTLHAGGINIFEGQGGQQWFEQIHIYPDDRAENTLLREDAKIEFGNILSQLDKDYIIYNAFRYQTATLSAIINGISPGITTPGVSAMDTITAQTSLYDPTSVFNDAVIDFDNRSLVEVRLRALLEGLANFNGNIDFVFDIATVTIRASGSRISIITEEYDFPFSETEEYLTDIIKAKSGTEQRIALRKNPREAYNTVFRLDGVSRQRFHAQIFGFHAQNFGLPLRHEVVRTTALVSPGSFQYQISGGDDVDFRVGGLAIALTDSNTFDVIPITALTDTLITSSSANQFSYPANTRIMPVRSVRIKGPIKTKMHKFGDIEEFTIIFENTDNVGSSSGSSTAWQSNTYLGKVILDECNAVGLTMSTTLDRQITVVDSQTGLVTQNSGWDRDQRVSVKAFRAANRAALVDLKNLFRYLRGKQKTFYLPTFTNDLTAAETLGSGQNYLDIERINYARFINNRDSKDTFRITFTDGGQLFRVIESSADHPTDADQERLTLDTTWPSEKLVSQVERIEWVELVRLDTDTVRYDYARIGLVKARVPVRVVFS